MATYADQADFEAYVEGWTTDDSGALDRLLQRAERDVDFHLVPQERQAATLLKYDPTKLSLFDRQQLTFAVCAQAEYRNTMGEDFFTEPQYNAVSSPDFSRTGKAPKLGPKAYWELSQAKGIFRPGRRSRP